MNIAEILAGATDLQVPSSPNQAQQAFDWVEGADNLFDMANHEDIESWYDVILHRDVNFEDAGEE